MRERDIAIVQTPKSYSFKPVFREEQVGRQKKNQSRSIVEEGNFPLLEESFYWLNKKLEVEKNKNADKAKEKEKDGLTANGFTSSSSSNGFLSYDMATNCCGAGLYLGQNEIGMDDWLIDGQKIRDLLDRRREAQKEKTAMEW